MSESTEALAERVRQAGAESPAAFQKVLCDALAPEITLIHVPATDHDGPIAREVMAPGWEAEATALDRGLSGYRLEPLSVKVIGDDLDIDVGHTGTLADGRTMSALIRMVLTVSDGKIVKLVGHNDPAGMASMMEALVAGGFQLPPGFEMPKA